MALFDTSTPRGFASQAMRNARIETKQIVRVSDWGTSTGEMEVLYVTPENEAHVAYIKPDGRITGKGLPW